MCSLNLLYIYIHQKVGLDYPFLLVEGDADKPVVGEGWLDHVLDGEKVLDDHMLLDVLVEYVHQQVGPDYPVLLSEGDADKPVVGEVRLDHAVEK